MKESWVTIEEAPDYQVSNLARVRRVKPDWQGKYAGLILRQKESRGYRRVDLRAGGKILTRSIHRLVCTAFNGPCPPEKSHCAHIDGDKQNNAPENLYWATPKENCADRERHGRTHRAPHKPEVIARISGKNHYSKKNPERVRRGAMHWRTGTTGLGAKGEQMGCAKLTEEAVKEIFLTPRRHGSGKMLAEKFGVSMGLVGHIRHGRSWRHVTDQLK